MSPSSVNLRAKRKPQILTAVLRRSAHMEDIAAKLG
jgi:hypothetical protein